MVEERCRCSAAAAGVPGLVGGRLVSVASGAALPLLAILRMLQHH